MSIFASSASEGGFLKIKYKLLPSNRSRGRSTIGAALSRLSYAICSIRETIITAPRTFQLGTVKASLPKDLGEIGFFKVIQESGPECTTCGGFVKPAHGAFSSHVPLQATLARMFWTCHFVSTHEKNKWRQLTLCSNGPILHTHCLVKHR
jgi:hypothetical protein